MKLKTLKLKLVRLRKKTNKKATKMDLKVKTGACES